MAETPVREKEPDENVEKDPLLSEAKIAHVVVPEAFITAATPAENVDSPASWRSPDGTRWLIATAKDTHRLVVYDGSTGKQLRTVAGPGSELGQMQRPNGIAVIDDLVLVVERDNRRVQVFQLPDFKPLLVFGADALKQPYGLWVRPQKDAYEVIVSDNYMSPQNEDAPPPLAELGQRFKRYHLQRAEGGWKATSAGTFGDTGEAGAIRIAESVFGDAANDRLLLAEEDVAVGTRLREYGLDGTYRGRDIGADLFKAQAEGMALAQCAGGSGYWIATDQFKDRSVFHVFDRLTLDYKGAFAGNRTANTDGVWLDQSADARFPQGAFYAVDDDQAVAAFDWRDIAKALSLPECRVE
ncbi:phytase [Pseudoxanthomonas sp. Root65]|uniref:phytase n=1 Tax=Pseudoxanthomonas sp. Root65 TaxID=1736576 RepID=UPI0006FA8325|nr:phytase [Pseudoxanthomonas sp. Root65]KRA54973.1 phytase [Pseudoxanthomonas sp. Root65]